MKKIYFMILVLGVVWAGAQTPQMTSASAQIQSFMTSPVVPLASSEVLPLTNQLVFPLTSQIGFTNTLVPPTNDFSTLQLTDVLTVLLSLQSNIEETLPVLALVTSNATVAGAGENGGIPGAVAPITSNPSGLMLPPTGAAHGALPAQTSFSMTVGTNTFTIDQPTLQALVVLRDDLEQALPVLQALNGTSPTNAIAPLPPVTNPAPVSFVPTPATNGFFIPMTNPPSFLAPAVSAF
jgi:hypothetical protein